VGSLEGVVDKVKELKEARVMAVRERGVVEGVCEGLRGELRHLEARGMRADRLEEQHRAQKEWLRGLMRRAGVADLHALAELVERVAVSSDNEEEEDQGRKVAARTDRPVDQTVGSGGPWLHKRDVMGASVVVTELPLPLACVSRR
jgi:hypothetical protein